MLQAGSASRQIYFEMWSGKRKGQQWTSMPQFSVTGASIHTWVFDIERSQYYEVRITTNNATHDDVAIRFWDARILDHLDAMASKFIKSAKWNERDKQFLMATKCKCIDIFHPPPCNCFRGAGRGSETRYGLVPVQLWVAIIFKGGEDGTQQLPLPPAPLSFRNFSSFLMRLSFRWRPLTDTDLGKFCHSRKLWLLRRGHWFFRQEEKPIDKPIHSVLLVLIKVQETGDADPCLPLGRSITCKWLLLIGMMFEWAMSISPSRRFDVLRGRWIIA